MIDFFMKAQHVDLVRCLRGEKLRATPSKLFVTAFNRTATFKAQGFCSMVTSVQAWTTIGTCTVLYGIVFNFSSTKAFKLLYLYRTVRVECTVQCTVRTVYESVKFF